MPLLTRVRWIRTALAATLIAAAGAGPARAQSAPEFDIAAQDAASALALFGEQSHLQLVFDYDAVQGIETRAVSGRLRVSDALGRMLSGTGLTFEVINDRTITILRDAEVRDGSATVARASGPKTPTASEDDDDWPRGVRTRPAASGAGSVDEIIVTAEKREETLQRSALAVTALASRVLERQQITDLKSVTTLIPNLQIGTSSTQAAFDLALRGIVSTNRTEIGDAAVAFHVDGFYSPRPQGATMLIQDLDRLEALRGPQGTLFGRNANAGVINVITAKPQFDATFGQLDLTLGSYSLTRLKGHLNVPVTDTFALRGAAFIEKRDGYTSFLPGSNVSPWSSRYDDSDKLAVRLSGLWEPNDAWRMFGSAERYVDRGSGDIAPALPRAWDSRLTRT
jgi:outer membrane receptor protein involved in Fe transport